MTQYLLNHIFSCQPSHEEFFLTSVSWIHVYCGKHIFKLSVVDLTILATISKNSSEFSYYRVLFVPFVPVFSIAVNCYLMTQLNARSWIRLGVF